MKEKLFEDMFNIVKVFAFLLIVCSIVIITISVCESAKHEFNLRKMLRLNEEKRLKKPNKKDSNVKIRHLKDFKVHIIDGNTGQEMDLEAQQSNPHRIHSLMPLQLPVHLPLPDHQFSHVMKNMPISPNTALLAHNEPHPDPYNDFYHHHLIHDHHDLHHIHHIHHHHVPEPPEPLMALSSSSTPIIFHQPFNSLTIPILAPDHMNNIPEHIPDHQLLFETYPVFIKEESPRVLEDNSRAHPTSYSFGEIDDTIMDNMVIDTNYGIHRKYNNLKHKEKVEKTVYIKPKSKEKPKNNNRFKNIDKQKGSDFEDKNQLENKESKIDPKIQKISSSNDVKTADNKDLNYDNSKQRFNFKIHHVPNGLPHEQQVDVSEDRHTFKDLDLWMIR